MNVRRIAQFGLLAVVAVTLVLVLRPRAGSEATDASATAAEHASTARFVAYYFHGDVRCDTCNAIETQAAAAIRDGFPEAIAAGDLVWKAVNTDRPENVHFAEEFALTHSTVVLVERDGTATKRFVALDQVWAVIHDGEDSFRQYVQDEVGTWLRATES